VRNAKIKRGSHAEFVDVKVGSRPSSKCCLQV
jgi:hypothetical protein